MKFYVQINLTNIAFTRFTSTAHASFRECHDNFLLTDPDESMNKERMYLCTRVDSYKLHDFDHERMVGCLEYDDFVVGATYEDRPAWFNHVKDRIVGTSADHQYGEGQGLKVGEFLTWRSANARIRCEESQWNRSGCVFKVKIDAKGDHTSFEDALHLHALILSGEIYK